MFSLFFDVKREVKKKLELFICWVRSKRINKLNQKIYLDYSTFCPLNMIYVMTEAVVY